MSIENKEEYLERCAHQRAALMAMVHNILSMSDDKLLKDAKMMISTCFKEIIKNEHMVGDLIDKMVLEKVKDFLEQEKAFRAANDIVNPENPL